MGLGVVCSSADELSSIGWDHVSLRRDKVAVHEVLVLGSSQIASCLWLAGRNLRIRVVVSSLIVESQVLRLRNLGSSLITSSSAHVSLYL